MNSNKIATGPGAWDLDDLFTSTPPVVPAVPAAPAPPARAPAFQPAPVGGDGADRQATPEELQARLSESANRIAELKAQIASSRKAARERVVGSADAQLGGAIAVAEQAEEDEELARRLQQDLDDEILARKMQEEMDAPPANNAPPRGPPAGPSHPAPAPSSWPTAPPPQQRPAPNLAVDRKRGLSVGGGSAAPAPSQEREWVPDELVKECMNQSCGQTFTFYYRRHHCRSCGLVFCYNCTQWRLGNNERACRECYCAKGGDPPPPQARPNCQPTAIQH